MSYGLNLGWGGTYRGIYRVLGGPVKGYTTNLVQGSYGMSLRYCAIPYSVYLRGTIGDTKWRKASPMTHRP